MKVIGYRGKKIKAVMAYVLSVIIGLIMESCGVIANRAHLLVVERQWEEVEWDDSNKTVRGPVFCVDVPLEGPKVLKDSVIEDIADTVVALQEKEDPTIPALLRQLTDCENRISNVMKAIESGIITETTKDRMDQLESEKKRLTLAISDAQYLCQVIVL